MVLAMSGLRFFFVWLSRARRGLRIVEFAQHLRVISLSLKSIRDLNVFLGGHMIPL